MKNGQPSQSDSETERAAKDNLSNLLVQEESMVKQKSRDRSLNLGDLNSKYFSSIVNANKKRAHIKSIINVDGTKYSDPSHIENVILGHFQGILAPLLGTVEGRDDLSHIKVTNKLSAVDSQAFCRPFSWKKCF